MRTLIITGLLALGLLAASEANAFLAGQPGGGGRGAYTDQRDSGSWSDSFNNGIRDFWDFSQGRALKKGKGGTGMPGSNGGQSIGTRD